MDQGIVEVTNYADEAEMGFQCSIHLSETHPGPWVFTLRQIKALCQDDPRRVSGTQDMKLSSHLPS